MRTETKVITPSALVSLGCHIKYHRLSDLNNRSLFAHSSGSWKVQYQVSGRISDEDSLPSLQTATFFLCPHMAFPWCLPAGDGWERGEKKREKALSCLFILLDQGPTLMTSFNINYFLIGSILKHSHMGVRVSHVNLGLGRGVTNIQSTIPSETQVDDISVVVVVKGSRWK